MTEELVVNPDDIDIDNGNLPSNPDSLRLSNILDNLNNRLKDTLHPEKPYDHHKVFVNEIIASWNKSIEGILETCFLLNEAKRRLNADDFKRVQAEINFTNRTINRLIAIHKDNRIRTHVSQLPPSWGTLYEIIKLDDSEFERAIEEKKIHPGMQRKDVAGLRNTNGGEKNENLPSNTFEGKIRAFVVYIDEDKKNDIDEILERFRSIDGIHLDDTPIEKIREKYDKSMKELTEKGIRKGRREALKVIKDYRANKIKELGKKEYLKGHYEVEEIFKSGIRQLVKDPYDPSGTVNLIDRALDAIGHDQKWRCSHYETKNLTS